MTDRFALGVQAIVTLALIGFSVFLYWSDVGPGADTLSATIIGGVMGHWFKESSAIARRSATELRIDEGDVTIEPEKAGAASKKTTTRRRPKGTS